MKVNELRIGNYINDGAIVRGMEGRTIWVEPFYIKGCYTPVTSYRVSQIKPIPLTEKWLKDFGFRKDKDSYFYKMAWSPGHPSARFDIEWKSELGLLLKSRYQEQSDQLTMMHIKHVHSLQNLYFALTADELTITKPNKD